MHLLVFGETGQLARALARRGAARGASIAALGRGRADLADPAACAAAIAASEAEVVVNAAAHTAVDQAEAAPETALAYAVNAEAPAAMARACAARGLPFLHVSTDYVFDGSGDRAWREDDPTAPLSVYGASKRAGEIAVAAAGGPHVVLRTSWVFSAHGRNFVTTMLRLGAERDELRVVDDQVGGPTPAAAIADALLDVAEAFRAGRGTSGLFHFAGTPPVSWAEFARAIFAARGGTGPVVRSIPTREYPTPARRPLNSVLDCGKIRAAYGIAQPDWRAALPGVIAGVR